MSVCVCVCVCVCECVCVRACVCVFSLGDPLGGVIGQEKDSDCGGFKVYIQILLTLSLQKVEPNSLPFEFVSDRVT